MKSDTWKDAASTWMSLLELRRQIGVERGIAVIDCIASDQKAARAPPVVLLLATCALRPSMIMSFLVSQSSCGSVLQ